MPDAGLISRRRPGRVFRGVTGRRFNEDAMDIPIPAMRLDPVEDAEDIEFIREWAHAFLTRPTGRNVCGCNLPIMNTIFIQETGKEPSGEVVRWWRELEDINRKVYAGRGGCLMASELAFLACAFISMEGVDPGQKQIPINLWRKGQGGNQ